MKAKIQIIIGLLTAVISIVNILMLLIPTLIYGAHSLHVSNYIYLSLILGLILPFLYSIDLIRKKPEQAKVLFLLWFSFWIISFILIYLLYNWLPLYNIFDSIVFFEQASVFPSTVFYFPNLRCLNIPEYCLILIRAINGLTVMMLLWIGVRGGFKQRINENIKQK